MNKINIGLIGYGNVGSGVAKFLQGRRDFIRYKFNMEFNIKTICDRSIHKKLSVQDTKSRLTNNVSDVLTDPEIDVVIELIGGLSPAREIVEGADRKSVV